MTTAPIMKIVGVNYSQNNLLRVVPFEIDNYKGIFNGIIDDGSTLTFISQSLRQKFSNLRHRFISCKTSGLNGQEQEINNEEIILPILDIFGRRILVEAIVVEQINPNISLPDYDKLQESISRITNHPVS